jgi:hypothetical protein
MGWGMHHTKTEALTFGVLKSRLIEVLNNEHQDVKLSEDEMHAIKCWIDLNCPLWGDYKYRRERVYPDGQTASRN